MLRFTTPNMRANLLHLLLSLSLSVYSPCWSPISALVRQLMMVYAYTRSGGFLIRWFTEKTQMVLKSMRLLTSIENQSIGGSVCSACHQSTHRNSDFDA